MSSSDPSTSMMRVLVRADVAHIRRGEVRPVSGRDVARFERFVGGCGSGCWPWVGHLDRSGYGTFFFSGVKVPAYRFAYEIARGLIPDHLEIDHLCRSRSCVRPDHLQAVPHRVNQLRGSGFVAVRARQTHCKRGHEFTEANTRRLKNGCRNCRACGRTRGAS
jgi:hypothetical protein